MPDGLIYWSLLHGDTTQTLFTASLENDFPLDSYKVVRNNISGKALLFYIYAWAESNQNIFKVYFSINLDIYSPGDWVEMTCMHRESQTSKYTFFSDVPETLSNVSKPYQVKKLSPQKDSMFFS